MLAIGAGGLDVAVAMAGGEYYITMPQVVRWNSPVLCAKVKGFIPDISTFRLGSKRIRK